MKKVLAVFDFDGTLTRKDTFLEFIKYHKGHLPFWFGFLKMSPLVLLHLLKIIPNWQTKEYVLTYFFRGVRINDFQHKCDEFSKNIIPRLIRKKALEKFEMHKKAGHEIVVISASAENWLAGWCKENGAEIIATQLEVEDYCLTGKIIGHNCYGPEKLIRLKKKFELEDFEEVYVYGDSRGDKEILEVATHAYYRKFF